MQFSRVHFLFSSCFLLSNVIVPCEYCKRGIFNRSLNIWSTFFLFLGDRACNPWSQEQVKNLAAYFLASWVKIKVSNTAFTKGGVMLFFFLRWGRGRGGGRLIFQKGSNYLIAESGTDCVLLPLILEMPDQLWTPPSLQLQSAEVTLVHVFYTLVAFSLLLAKQTFLFLHTFMLILWFLKLDSGSWRPEFPQQLEALSATASWQADN